MKDDYTKMIMWKMIMKMIENSLWKCWDTYYRTWRW